MDFIYFTEMDFGTPRWSRCGICCKREKGFWIDGNVDCDIICRDCDATWKYDENRDGYVRRPRIDPENGMFLCPCGKEANEDSLWCDDHEGDERNIRIFTDGVYWNLEYKIKGEKAIINRDSFRTIYMIIISDEEHERLTNDDTFFPYQLQHFEFRRQRINLQV
jgi:hypothetical protein